MLTTKSLREILENLQTGKATKSEISVASVAFGLNYSEPLLDWPYYHWVTYNGCGVVPYSEKFLIHLIRKALEEGIEHVEWEHELAELT